MRFLRLIKGKYSLLKKARIGFTLLKSSFRAVFFSHHQYIFFSGTITVIQFLHLKITGLIHHRLTLTVVITQLLAGENFFEIAWHDTDFALSDNNIFTLLSFTTVLYIEIILIFFVLSAVSYYTFKQNYSVRKSVSISLGHWRTICVWGLFELCAQAISASMGTVGALLYFVWNVATIFDVQIISFDSANAYQVLQKSWHLFKQNMSEIVALDVIIEGILITTGFFLYAVSKRYIAETGLIATATYSDILIFFMLYLIATVMIFETVVFTNLYKAIKKIAR